ncbi:hypothetical protein RZS08_58270, partial [Arthrospira platensis SPKY1]|nr:hypothetical protein [Arthrospira platensis SPKY1]
EPGKLARPEFIQQSVRPFHGALAGIETLAGQQVGGGRRPGLRLHHANMQIVDITLQTHRCIGERGLTTGFGRSDHRTHQAQRERIRESIRPRRCQYQLAHQPCGRFQPGADI